MFDFVHEKKRLVQVVLLLLILPFALWGVDSYNKSGTGEFVAKVNGEKISQQEFDSVLQQQQAKMREMMGGGFDAAMFDKPEIRSSILDNLISQRLLVEQAQAAGLTVSDAQLAQVVAGIEAFQKDGKFDQQRYQSLLAQQQMTPPMFESKVRQELALRQLTDAYTQSGYAAGSVTDNLIRLAEQQRVISVATVSPAAFLSQANVSEADIQKYYAANAAEFKTPEQARLETVTLSVAALLPSTEVSDAEVKKYYDEHQAEFGVAEQREAAHILITVGAQASAAEKDAAKARAQKVLDQLKQQPAKFAELAKQFSQDPGSAANGGSLGYFGRGAMVKPFEDAVFSLKTGEISGLVQSDFGFHIIKLTGIKAARSVPLAEVKSPLAEKIRQQKASDRFAELAEKFSNLVYEQSDTLKPAAELAKLPTQQTGWLARGNLAGNPLWTDKFQQAVFNDDVLKNKRNSAAVEVAPNTLVAARLLEYKPSSQRPLAEVSPLIRQKLLGQQAQQLAIKQGKTWLEQLQHGEKVAATFSSAQTISRGQHGQLDTELVRQIFQLDAAKLPAFAGAETAQGYVLVQLTAVKDLETIDAAKRERYGQQLRQITGEALLQAYVLDARKHADISIKPLKAAETK